MLAFHRRFFVKLSVAMTRLGNGWTGKKARMDEEEGRNFGRWCQCLVGDLGDGEGDVTLAKYFWVQSEL